MSISKNCTQTPMPKGEYSSEPSSYLRENLSSTRGTIINTVAIIKVQATTGETATVAYDAKDAELRQLIRKLNSK